jgi:hypothetical protein
MCIVSDLVRLYCCSCLIQPLLNIFLAASLHVVIKSILKELIVTHNRDCSSLVGDEFTVLLKPAGVTMLLRRHCADQLDEQSHDRC